MTLAAINNLHCYSRFLYTLEANKMFTIFKEAYYFTINIF